MAKYLVWQNDDTEEHAVSVEAFDAEYACEKAAHDLDNGSGGECFDQHDRMEVFVREDSEGSQPMRFSVERIWTTEYSARTLTEVVG